MPESYGLHAIGMVNALGRSVAEIAPRLFAGDTSRLSPHRLVTTGEEVLVGRVHGNLPDLPPELIDYDCRIHRLSAMAYAQIADEVGAVIQRYGAHRLGVVLGSSTGGLDATEDANAVWRETGELPPKFSYKKQHAMGSVSDFVAEIAGAAGPAYTVSTACTSSVKAMASARDLLAAGVCDAVITGGVDCLCHMTLNGFEALGTLTRSVSVPMSGSRTGLNIGEGAAFFVMTRESALVNFLGVGESCDAYHMSSPHPEGEGAESAMRAALADAGLEPADISYLNMHGTGTPQNDAMESKAIERVFSSLPCASTKPMVGHCLGGAGAIEVGFCLLALSRPEGEAMPLPPHVWDDRPDPNLPALQLVLPGQTADGDGNTCMMSNSFAFGGNNCAVIVGRRLG